ncbi:signal peptidase I [Corallococcus terminator]|uniref:Signal peptidase I n=2 Tax=Corallococcus terminator TaxID=2316733 RepID=A0A3A8JC79_9BACT|nr:signal peptidase I [Corallococcus terminator]
MQEQQSAGPSIVVTIFYLAFIGAMVAGMWKTFAKAGEPGWAAIVPIYNIYVMTKIVGRPAWWIVLALIPCVNFIALIILGIDMAKSFGKDTGFGIGLGLLGPVFYAILGFGDARYQGPAAAGGGASAA